MWQRRAAWSKLPSFARLPRRGRPGLRGCGDAWSVLRLPSFARLPRRGRLGLRGCGNAGRRGQNCRALLGCPDEGVRAYVDVATHGACSDCRALLGCPDEGVWAYVSVETHGGVLSSFSCFHHRVQIANDPLRFVVTQEYVSVGGHNTNTAISPHICTTVPHSANSIPAQGIPVLDRIVPYVIQGNGF